MHGATIRKMFLLLKTDTRFHLVSCFMLSLHYAAMNYCAQRHTNVTVIHEVWFTGSVQVR